MANQQSQLEGFNNKNAFNLLYLLVSAHSWCVLPFLRRGVGREMPGIYGIAAFLGMTFLACEDQVVWHYLGVWFFVLVVLKASSLRAARRGEWIHSRYSGFPWVAMNVPFIRSEKTAMGFVEPAIVFVVGTLLCPLSVNLGGLVLTSAISLMLKYGIEDEIDRQRMQQMRDAEIEMRYYAERYGNPWEE